MRICWGCVAILCSIANTHSTAIAAAADTTEEVWLAVNVNGEPSEDVSLFLRTSSGKLLAPAEQLSAWHLRVPGKVAVSHLGEKFIPLDALQGVTYSIDEDKQALMLEASAKSFEQITVNLRDRESVRAPSPPLGGFVNYDFVASTDDSHTTLSGLFEPSIFGPAGAVLTQYLVHHDNETQETRGIRLDSTWTIDHPDTISSLRVGDSVTGTTAWGGAVRFGGIQWASNYTTRPGLITMPLPSVLGEAALPSTLNLYVDNTLRLQRNITGGQIRMDDIPVITGTGDIRLVVRDILGREQVFTEPYYASTELLRAGLREYSFEAGFVRNNYGIASLDYGRPLVVATDRVGLTDWLTGEVHAEALEKQQTLGLSGSVLLSEFGVLDTSVALSHGPDGQGELYRIGFQHTARRLSLGGAVQYSTHGFARLGILPTEPVQALNTQLFVSIGLGHLGSLSMTGTRESYYLGHAVDIVTLRDNINCGWLGYLNLSVSRVAAGTSDTLVTLGLSHPINARTGVSVTSSVASSSGTTTELDLQQNLPAGRGVGYRLIADTGAVRAVDGNLLLQGDSGTYQLETRRQARSSQTQLSVNGGIAVLGGQAFSTRHIDGSFAAVQVGDQKGVGIYRENQLVGQTDNKGYLLVPGLRPYQSNDLRIEQADLPLDIVVDTVQARAVPYFRSGVVVKFPVEHPRGALVTVRLEDDTLIPPGAIVRLEGQENDFPSGMNGEVYVAGLGDRNVIHVYWNGAGCEFTMTFTPSDDPLPRLGPYVCKRVAP